MEAIGGILSVVTSIVNLVCFIMVVVKMFQHGQTVLGIACILLVFCFGIGLLIAFIFGWVRHRDWGLTNIMMIWTGAIILGIVAGIIAPDPFGLQKRLQVQPQ